MTRAALVARSLRHYWRTNAAVIAGVATAVAVLAGALLVGDSVRGTLRDLALGRLGQTDAAVLASRFFREDLDVSREADVPGVRASVPLVVLDGFVTAQVGGGRAGNVFVYGVDDRFWRFHGIAGVEGPDDRGAFVSEALAREIGAGPDAPLLVRIVQPSKTPLESLHAAKDDIGRTLRFTLRAVLTAGQLGEFSLRPAQGDVRAVFVPLARLQAETETAGRVNALLAAFDPVVADRSSALAESVRRRARLEDLGLGVDVLDGRAAFAVQAESGILASGVARAAVDAVDVRDRATPVLTYLANSIRIGSREVPYSLVTAVDLEAIWPDADGAPGGELPPLVLNDWAARDLQARVGDEVILEYYVWEDPGRLVTRSATFSLAATVPTDTTLRDLAPDYAGITDSPSLSNWEPPFPIDLRRIRPVDEQYWDQHRTTPKAFIPLETGQALWRSRHGELTSIRITPGVSEPLETARTAYASRFRAQLDPLAMGLVVRDVRAEALAASRGATDFGEYFLYFSFFLMVSALVLAALFFKLGVEQRVREIGLFEAVGFGRATVRRLFVAEALMLSLVGTAIGLLAALAYASFVLYGLRTWWIDAVGTSAIALHVQPLSLAAGALGGIVAGVACTAWTLRGLASVSGRSLLSGQLAVDVASYGGGRPFAVAAAALTGGAALLLGAAALGMLAEAGAFFGAGALLLLSGLAWCAWICRRRPRALTGHGGQSVLALGLRNATYRPGRTVMSVAVIAAAVFVLMAVETFRRDGPAAAGRDRGTGGYALIAESLLPIVHDPATPAGRDALNLFDLDDISIQPFRVRPGDDVSCLNLYSPQNPRVVAASDAFIEAGRFAFRDALASTAAEQANPWLLLKRREADGAIPAIGDANSMAYVLHRKPGEDIVIETGGRTITLRLVATLDDSIFQGELIVDETAFLEIFPGEDGYRLLLIETPSGREASARAGVEDALADFGVDVGLTSERLAGFHRVENTYLSTFQALGGLGLLLGTIGLAAVVMRNVLERRRELALLAAVGYERRHFRTLLTVESASVLAGGLLIGVVAATVAVLPAIAERGGRLPISATTLLVLVAVAGAGLVSTLAAVRAATRTPLLDALRSE